MAFPKPSILVADGDDVILKTYLAGDAVRVTITVRRSEEHEAAEALDLVVSEFVSREPLLHGISRALGREHPVSRAALLVYMKALWEEHWGTSCVAVVSGPQQPASQPQQVCNGGGTATIKPPSAIAPGSRKLSAGDQIVGACFCRVVEEPDQRAAQKEAAAKKMVQVLQDADFTTNGQPTTELDYFIRTFPTPINPWGVGVAHVPAPAGNSHLADRPACAPQTAKDDPGNMLTTKMNTEKEPHVSRRMLEIGLIAVHSQYSNRRVGEALMTRCISLAKAKGCGMMKVDCTSHFLFKMLANLNFSLVKELICLPDYVYEAGESTTESVCNTDAEDSASGASASSVSTLRNIERHGTSVDQAPTSILMSLPRIDVELDYPHNSLHVMALKLTATT